MLRGDHELNEIKAGKLPGLAGFRFATESEIVEHFGCKPGYLGPVGTARPVRVVADRTVAHMADFVCGANKEHFHIQGVNWGRDLPEPEQVADLRNVVAGDPSPDGKGTLSIMRGIEVGHVFYLGKKYLRGPQGHVPGRDRQARHAGNGLLRHRRDPHRGRRHRAEPRRPRHHLAARHRPFEVVICPVGWGKSETVRDTAQKLYESLLARGVDVILDDRDARPGVMFAEWELIGAPLRVTVGERGLNDGVVELQARRETEAVKIPVQSALEQVLAKLDTL